MEASTEVSEPANRWLALRTVSTVFRVLAWVIVGLGGLAVLIGAVSVGASDGGGIGGALLTLIFGAIAVGFYALITFAVSELIMIGIAIEENTRRTADGLRP